jgi:hypothetical protein
MTQVKAEALERKTDRASCLEEAEIAFPAAWDALG